MMKYLASNAALPASVLPMAAASAQDLDNAAGQRSVAFFNVLVDMVSGHVLELAIVALATAVFTALMAIYRKRRKKKGPDADAPFFGRDAKGHNMLLLGLGASGKTTLLRKLSNDQVQELEEKTQGCKEYTISLGEVHQSDGHRELWIRTVDFQGQRLHDLVKELFESQSSKNSTKPHLKYGYITALVLVVDIAPAPEASTEPRPRFQHLQPDRIQQHITAWNQQALQAVGGFLTQRLRTIILYVNAIDAVDDYKDSFGVDGLPQATYEELKGQFKEIIKLLDEIRGLETKVVVGSMLYGGAKDEIRKILEDTAVTDEMLKR